MTCPHDKPLTHLRRVLIIALLTCGLLTQGHAADERLTKRRSVAPQYDELKQNAVDKREIPVIARFKVAAPNGRSAAERRESGRQRLGTAMAQYDLHAFAEFRRSGMSAFFVDATQLDMLVDSEFVDAVWESKPNKAHLQQSNNLIQSQVAREYGLTGSGTTVVILDTGIDSDHATFDDRVVWEACFSTTSSAASASNLCPDGTQTGSSGRLRHYSQVGPGAAALTKCTDVECWHGTHVASIAAGSDATYTGIAPDAAIIAIQVFSRFDSDSSSYCGAGNSPCVLSYDHDQLAALEYVAELDASNDIAAVNMSLGGGMNTSACTSSLAAAVGELKTLDVVVTASAGNSGWDDAMSEPACLSDVISVGSVRDTDDTVSSFSNSASFLDILAPGQSITAADAGGGFLTANGTSMAAPHVAGAIALLKAYDATLSHAEVKSLLTGNGVPILDSRNGLTFPRLDLGLLTLAVAGGPAGDANHDGTVDITDLWLIQQHITDRISLDADAIRRCDVYPVGNPDGELDLSDLLELQRIVVSE